MDTLKIAATRRVGLFLLLFAGSTVGSPAFAACNPGAFNVNPKNQTNVLEYNAGSGYARVLVTLGINKSLAADSATGAWAQTSGPIVTLNTSNPQNPTFLTPDVPSAGATLTFRLTVTCPGGAQASDTGTVSIIDVNRPPVAVASSTPAIAYIGDTIALRSTGPSGTPVSSDPDGDALVYQWTKTAGPAGLTVNLTGASTATASFVAPAPVPVGDYTLQFQLVVRDRATGGLTATANVTVNITRNLPPLAKLTCPIQVNEHGHVVLDGSASFDPNGGPLTYQWTQLQGSPAISVGSESGSTVQFDAPALTTGQDGFVQFQLKATDSTGLWDLATCGMQVVDVTAPVISVPADMTLEADSAGGKSASYSVYAQDAVDDAAPYPIACTPPSGSTFALAAPPTQQKISTVACTAHDSSVRPGFPSGNVANAAFQITVRDTTAPIITVPGALGAEATGPGGASATFSATTADAVDGSGIATCSPASGSTFALGTTAVSCNATDARNNAAVPAHFNLTIHDTTKPVVTPPADVTAEATGTQTVVAYGTATATDAVGVVSITSDAPATFPVGGTTVHWTAKDAAGNSGFADSHVTVQDTTAPAIDAHAAINGVEATGASGAAVTYTAPATHDTVDGDGIATCAPVSGSTFSLGTSVVTCHASDAHGNAATATAFDVTVVDTTPPSIDAHGAIADIEATGPTGAAVNYTAPATHDLVDGNGIAVCTPMSGSLFALGTTTVTCHASDAHHNAATATTFDVTVVDTTPPSIDVHDDILAVEATGPEGAVVTYTSPATHDIVDGDGSATCSA
ncbi:MAG: Hyalin, partial [Xanthomonadaceae bacterium]|nr:Hyalin [Xanthomonadaceae bacterium]